ncbi:MAG: hypothetical protein FWF90_09225 [Promicromonosporaceae bacterium]|nr:hypothetical protein [Promicromonosporaceae bacterium]
MISVVFRLGRGAAAAVLGFCQAWMPTNWLVRWIYTDRGALWGFPISAVLVPGYFALGHCAEDRLAAGGSNWWWAVFAWAVVNCLKFVSVGLRAPIVWAVRKVRRVVVGRSA